MKKNNFVDYLLKDAMGDIAGIEARAMFGGHGLYKNGLVFAILADDVLYFKVDEKNLAYFKELGSKPFSYQSKKKNVVIQSYWSLPSEVLDDREELAVWVERSAAASRRKRKEKAKS